MTACFTASVITNISRRAGFEIVCLATSTASGKSLVFIVVALHLLATAPNAKVLALYPARALIQDQLLKWEEYLTGSGRRVGYMDGGIPAERRPQILRASNVVLMTPDVAHAWLMSNLREWEVSSFLGNLRLLVLDEAHVYEGVFGTNMAHFLRRLGVVAADHRLICSTATLGAPETFTCQLTGRGPVCLGRDADASATPERTILLARETAGKPFESMVGLMVALARAERGRSGQAVALAVQGRI